LLTLTSLLIAAIEKFAVSFDVSAIDELASWLRQLSHKAPRQLEVSGGHHEESLQLAVEWHSF